MSPEQNQPQYGSPPPPPGYGGGGGGGGYGGPPGYGGGGGGGYPQKASNGMGIAALVLGIIGILTCWFIFGGFFGLLALIFGIIGRKKVKRGEATNGGMALTGIILGAISLLIAIVFAVIVGLLAEEFGSLAECLENAGNDTVAQQECQTEFQNQFE